MICEVCGSLREDCECPREEEGEPIDFGDDPYGDMMAIAFKQTFD